MYISIHDLNLSLIFPYLSLFFYDYRFDYRLGIVENPPFEENERVEPIPINDEIRDLRGREVLISGWGATTKKSSSANLKKAFVRITSQSVGAKPKKRLVLNMYSPNKDINRLNFKTHNARF